jgi:hypothetical protein
VDAAGLLTFSGRLADGKPITHSAQVSTNGIWPLYVPLFGGRGIVLSWVQLNTNPPPVERLHGDAAVWTRPPVSTSAYYPAGFDVETSVVGSAYRATNPVLPLGTNGLIQFVGGNLAAPLAFPLTLTSTNTVIGPASLTLSITRSNGLFSGTFQLPGTTTAVTFQGAILQSHTNGHGHFRNAGQSGWVHLGLAP